ncbi:MFS transporter [bacterium]|nr:MFS transporter [bacterium]
MANNRGYFRIWYLPHWHYPPQLPGLTGLYLNTIFRVLATGLIGIFVPVFVYQVAQSWKIFFSYYFLNEFFFLSSVIPAAFLIKKKGPDFSVGLAAVFQLLGIIFLIKSQNNLTFLYWAAVFLGIAGPFHWIPYHLAFSQESTRKIISRQLVTNALLGKIAAALAPLIGGIIITLFGFSAVYLIASIILAISVLPIFIDQYNQRGENISLKQLKTTFLDKKLTPLWWGFWGAGLEAGVYGIFWPLFLYQCFRNMEKMGLLSTLSLLFSVLVLSYLGKNGQKKAKKLFKFGITASAPNWLFRSLVSSFSLLTLLDVVYQLTTMFIWIPVGSLVYQWGREKQKPFFVIREVMIHLGILTALGGGILARQLNLPWKSLFFLPIAAMLAINQFYYGLEKTQRSSQ